MTDVQDLARRFHETYERLAPFYGYRAREASAVPWGDVPEQNKQLMIAIAERGEHGAALAVADILDVLNQEELISLVSYSVGVYVRLVERPLGDSTREAAREVLREFHEDGMPYREALDRLEYLYSRSA